MFSLSVTICSSAIVYYYFNITIALLFGSIIYVLTGGYRWLRLFVKTFPRDISFLLKILMMLKRMRSDSNNSKKIVTEMFSETVKKYSNKVAIISAETNQRMTFQDVEELVNKIGNIFHKMGFGYSDVIGLYMKNEIEYIPIWLGLSKIGAVTALINCNLTGDSLKHIIKAGNCKAIIYHEELEEHLLSIKGHLSNMTFFFLGSSPEGNGLISLTNLISKALTEVPKKPNGLTLENHMLYISTSGTTGLPKAAILPGRKVLTGFNVFNVFTDVTANDVVYNTLPMYHTSGSVIFGGQMILRGATLVIRKTFSASKFFRDCVKYDVTYIGYIGEMCRYLLMQPESEFDRMHKIRCAVGVGMRRSLVGDFKKRFVIRSVYESYGATEGNSGFINCTEKEGAIGFMLVSLWFLNVKKLVKVNGETGEISRNRNGFAIECKPGEPGLLVNMIFKGQEFDGYVDKIASEKKIARDVFKKGDSAFLTGDLLEMDELGYLYFIDRLGDTFRWKGENVSTTEVENTICKLLKFNDVLVYPVPLPGVEGKAGMAYIFCEVENLDISELAIGLQRTLPKYAVPMFLRLGKNVSVTGTQKHQKMNLKKESFNPNVLKVDEKLFYYNKLESEYEILDSVKYDMIMKEEVKF